MSGHSPMNRANPSDARRASVPDISGMIAVRGAPRSTVLPVVWCCQLPHPINKLAGSVVIETVEVEGPRPGAAGSITRVVILLSAHVPTIRHPVGG